MFQLYTIGYHLGMARSKKTSTPVQRRLNATRIYTDTSKTFGITTGRTVIKVRYNMLAVCSGHTDTAEMLLGTGKADVNARNNHQSIALLLAAQSG